MKISMRLIKQGDYGHISNLTERQLNKVLDRLDQAYHNDMEPLVSDDIYDLVFDTLVGNYPDTKRKQKTGHRIGNKQEEVKLPNFMPSLQKIKPDTKEFTKYVDTYIGPYVLSDKLDGISLQIVYEGGKPVKIYTRGDGTMGKDVTRHVKNFKIPKRIKTKARLSVRAEAILKDSVFDRKFSKDSGGKYTAARNTAGGFINNTKGDSPGLKSVDVVIYEMLEGPNSNKKLSTQLKYLESLGFDVVNYRVVKSIDSAKLSKYYASRIKASPYEIDGIVVSHNEPYVRTSSLPKHAKAFKENSRADMKDVVVTHVDWQMSKGGKIIPRIFYKKTSLGGVSNDKATGHNAFFVINGFRLKEQKLNKPVMPLGPGAVVRIVRSGKVIPHIVEVIKPARGRKPQMPSVPYVLRGADAYFAGERHDDTHAKQLTHFFVTIGVDGLKLSSTKKLMGAGYDTVKNIMDADESDLSKIEGVGPVKAKQWTRQIKMKAKGLTPALVADASAIFIGFSRSRLDTIFEALPSNVYRVLDAPKAKIVSKIKSIGGFNKLAEEFVNHLPAFRRFLGELDIKIKNTPKKAAPKTGKLSGTKITFTGVRDKQLQAAIENVGGVVQNMKADTNMLIIKDESYQSSKIDKAQDKGIPVLTLAEFKKKHKL